MLINEAKQKFGKVLTSLTDQLDIPPVLYEKAVDSYNAVTRWLAEGDELGQFDLDLFPQGSFKIGTVVRPIGEDDEYDIDLICLVDIEKDLIHPQRLWQMVGDRLKEHGVYAKILEEKDRCWRLNYAGEFHMDILPAVPNPLGGIDAILVPTKKLLKWRPSNPRGFAEWFEDQQKHIKSILEKAAAAIEPVPPNKRIKTPLQRSVQILKRHRDILFADNPKDKPISMIITTLAGQAYQGEEDVTDALNRILSDMPNYIIHKDNEDRIENPVDRSENFADKWKEEPQRKENFYTWLNRARQDLSGAQQFNEYKDIAKSIRGSFGDSIVDETMFEVEGASVPILKADVLPSLLYARHKKDPLWKMDVRDTVKIVAQRSRNGFRTEAFRSNSPSLPKRCSLRFKAITKVKRPFTVYWQIVNTGGEAVAANCLRGDFYEGELHKGGLVRMESTLYSGNHSIECFIVKNDVCVAHSDVFIVNIN